MPSRWYRSKVDWWLGVLLGLAPALVVVGGVLAVVGGAPSDAYAAVGGLAVLGAVYGGLVLPMRYGMSDRELVVRHGLVRQRIRLADITEVKRTRSPLSSPALSLDRLAVKFGEGMFRSVMISPLEREAFLEELARKAGLARDGEGLRRA
jgi:hypothetical protein